MKQAKTGKAKAKGAAGVATRKQTSSKPVEKVTPTHLPDGFSFRMGLHDVVKVVQMIEKQGLLTKFTRTLQRAKAEAVIPAGTVNLVKDFVAENGLHKSPIGKHIVNARAKTVAATNEVAETASAKASSAKTAFAKAKPDPNQCNFGTAEQD